MLNQLYLADGHYSFNRQKFFFKSELIGRKIFHPSDTKFIECADMLVQYDQKVKKSFFQLVAKQDHHGNWVVDHDKISEITAIYKLKKLDMKDQIDLLIEEINQKILPIDDMSYDDLDYSLFNIRQRGLIKEYLATHNIKDINEYSKKDLIILGQDLINNDNFLVKYNLRFLSEKISSNEEVVESFNNSNNIIKNIIDKQRQDNEIIK